jgi:hypothetical protein
LGVNAGFDSTTGSNSIDIGNPGVAAESGTIRIGSQGTQTKTFVAGIFGSIVTGDAVVVSNIGQLGIVVSSARYKRDIHDMWTASSKLLKLRPVTCYNHDPLGNLQYGLVAEEVAEVSPELVTRGLDGRIESVSYPSLTSMLLNELQKRTTENQRQASRLAGLEQRLSTLERTTPARGRTGLLCVDRGSEPSARSRSPESGITSIITTTRSTAMAASPDIPGELSR